MHYTTKGIVYVSLEWVFVLVQFLVITLRIYSRTFLTRSVGSDDFSIVIGFVRFMLVPLLSSERAANDGTQLLNVVAIVSDLKAFLNGWAQHESALTPGEYAAEEKWYDSYPVHQLCKPLTNS